MPAALTAKRGLTLAIGEMDKGGVVTVKLFPPSVVRAKYAAVCPHTMSTPLLGSTAIWGTGALLPEAIPLPCDTFTGGESQLLEPFAKLLKKMSPPPALLVPAHATYTPAELTAICGCDASEGRFVVATVIVAEKVWPPLANRLKRILPESIHTTSISPPGPTAIAGIEPWPVPERLIGAVRNVCALSAAPGSGAKSISQAIVRMFG